MIVKQKVYIFQDELSSIICGEISSSVVVSERICIAFTLNFTVIQIKKLTVKRAVVILSHKLNRLESSANRHTI